MELVNTTPFAAERVVLHDRSGREMLVVIVKCTYTLRADGALQIADEQVRIQIADEFHGEPGVSSPRYESDLAPRKTGTDLILLGHAYSPKRKVPHIDVVFKVGKVARTSRVFGDRIWTKTMGMVSMSAPEPFDRMMLVWERAFGGQDLSAPDPSHHERETRNPVGRGFVAKKTAKIIDGLLLPNIEDPTALIGRPSDRPVPMGFGFLGRHWQPRLPLAGTYDDPWMKSRAPLLPVDFDDAYHNGAPGALVARPFLRGDEPVEIVNASKSSSLRFMLPGNAPGVRLLMGEDPFSIEPVLDTLTVEPDLDRLSMVWRATHDVHRRIDQMEGIEISQRGRPNGR